MGEIKDGCASTPVSKRREGVARHQGPLGVGGSAAWGLSQCLWGAGHSGIHSFQT